MYATRRIRYTPKLVFSISICHGTKIQPYFLIIIEYNDFEWDIVPRYHTRLLFNYTVKSPAQTEKFGF
jgi:hypothetical protein